MKASIFLQRHGETYNNIKKVFTCRKLDPGLTDVGRKQIEENVKYYKNFKIKKIVSSPSKRALETAQILALGLGINFEVDENLLEVDVGDLEGKSELDPLNLEYFYDTIEKWISDGENVRFQGGESKYKIEQRLKNIKRNYLNPDKGASTILVGHATLFAVLIGQYIKTRNIKDLFLSRGGFARYNNITFKWDVVQ